MESRRDCPVCAHTFADASPLRPAHSSRTSGQSCPPFTAGLINTSSSLHYRYSPPPSSTRLIPSHLNPHPRLSRSSHPPGATPPPVHCATHATPLSPPHTPCASPSPSPIWHECKLRVPALHGPRHRALPGSRCQITPPWHERPLAHARQPNAGRWMSRKACSHTLSPTLYDPHTAPCASPYA